MALSINYGKKFKSVYAHLQISKSRNKCFTLPGNEQATATPGIQTHTLLEISDFFSSLCENDDMVINFSHSMNPFLFLLLFFF